MISFQASPVEMAKRRRNPSPNRLKFLNSGLMTLPSEMSEKKKTPSVANMKKISIRSKNTFKIDWTERSIVCRSV